MIREQFWRGNAQRRGNQDEKRRPWHIMVAPNPDRCKLLVTVPRAVISSVIPFRLAPDSQPLGVIPAPDEVGR